MKMRIDDDRRYSLPVYDFQSGAPQPMPTRMRPAVEPAAATEEDDPVVVSDQFVEKQLDGSYKCKLCIVNCYCQATMRSHLEGQKHRKKIDALKWWQETNGGDLESFHKSLYGDEGSSSGTSTNNAKNQEDSDFELHSTRQFYVERSDEV
jgi:hypothetical protein